MQDLLWIIPVIVVAAALSLTMFIKYSNKKLRNKINSEFGRVPKHEDFEADSVNGYHFYTIKENKSKEYIDSITWNDLNMDDVYQRIDNCQTSIGQEHLYNMMHEVYFDEEQRADYNDLLNIFSDSKKREDTQVYLAKLGKSRNRISSLIFEPTQYKLRVPSFVYTILAITVLLFIAAAIVCAVLSLKIVSLFFALCFVNIVVNIVLYYLTKLNLENQLNMMSYFSGILWSVEKISKIPSLENIIYFTELRKECKKLKYIKSKISRKATAAAADLDYFKEFLYMIFLVDVRKYNKSIKSVIDNIDTVKHISKCIGEIDVSINTLSFMKSVDICCRPSFCKEDIIEFDGVYHPLLKKPVLNSGDLDKNIIITGANASGKSTFIKSVAINNILALSLNVCCAKSYKLRRTLTLTSMAQSDDILKGESYYIVELKSFKRILDKIKEKPCSCFIDEILKGTNTVERIAASISALEYLSKMECFCLIATHDTEIAQTLEGRYTNFHFEEKISESDIEFDYILKKGIATSRNAVKLLGFFDYPSEIVNEANLKVDEYERTKRWDKQRN